MKRFLILIIVLVLANLSVHAHSSRQEQLVRITDVYCDWRTSESGSGREIYGEVVCVELTSAGIRYMEEYGWDEISVTIGPDNNFFSMLIDLRKSKTVTLSLDSPYGSVTFKTRTMNCGEGDFEIENIEWFRYRRL